MKKTWVIIKDVLNKSKPSKINDTFKYNNVITTDKSTIANRFNDYFVRIGKTLSQTIRISGTNYRSFLPRSNYATILLKKLTKTMNEELVIKYIG